MINSYIVLLRCECECFTHYSISIQVIERKKEDKLILLTI